MGPCRFRLNTTWGRDTDYICGKDGRPCSDTELAGMPDCTDREEPEEINEEV